MLDTPMLEILLAAVVAGIVLFRLYMVLGRRTGHENPPPEQYRRQTAPSGDNVVAIPDRSAVRPGAVSEKPADGVAAALLDIKLADRKFESDHFLSGARSAYEIIVTAFAAGNRQTLRPLLSDEVYAAFDGVIHGHEERKEKVDFTFVGFSDAKITHAELKNRVAEITVTFAAKYISTTASPDGSIVEGDPKAVREVTDIWTCARDTGARDPNWTLIATSGEPH
jgi:predicted lipid-binding transport protein (Tim44 family)